jgi:hypothetical protein
MSAHLCPTLITALTFLTVNAQPQESQTNFDTELTLKEAYHLGLDIALKWDSRVMLSRIGSVDDPNQVEVKVHMVKGENGAYVFTCYWFFPRGIYSN